MFADSKATRLIGLGVLTFIAVISAVVWHVLVKRYLGAVSGSVVTTVFAFQIANYLHLGYIDPFAVIAMIMSGLIALAVSAIIGLPFRSFRRKHTGAHNPPGK